MPPSYPIRLTVADFALPDRPRRARRPSGTVNGQSGVRARTDQLTRSGEL